MKSLGSLRLQPYDEEEINKYTKVEHRFVCNICTEICFSIEKLKSHYEVHGYFFEPKTEPEMNTAQVFNEKKPSYYSSKICEICSVSFKNSKILSKHVKTVHNKLKSFSEYYLILVNLSLS